MKDFFIMVAKTITAISVVAVIWLWGYQVGGDKSAQLIEVLKEQRGGLIRRIRGSLRKMVN